MSPWQTYRKIETLLLDSKLPVSISRNRGVGSFVLCYPRDLSRVAREHPGEVRSRLSSRYPQHQKSCARTHSHAHTLSHTVRGWGLATVRDDQETLYRLWSELCSLSDDDDDDVYHHIGERLNLEGAEPVRLCQRFAIDIRSVLEESLDRGRQDKIKREGLVQTFNTVQAAQILPTCSFSTCLFVICLRECSS